MKVRLDPKAKRFRFDVALLSFAAVLDISELFLRGNKKSLKLLKNFSNEFKAEPPLYNKKNNTFVGVPLHIDNSIEFGIFVVEPSGDLLEV